MACTSVCRPLMSKFSAPEWHAWQAATSGSKVWLAPSPRWQLTQVFSTIVACALGVPSAPAPATPSSMALCGPWCGPQCVRDARDHAVHGLRKGTARLMAGCAQVARTAVEGHAFHGIHLDGSDGLQRPILTGVGGVDGVACPAVLAGGIGIPGFNRTRVQARSDHGAEGATGVAAGAAGARAA